MSRPLSCSQALLNEIEPRDPSTWSDAFDKVLKDVLEQCRPGYVEIPTDAIHYKVSSEGLKKLLVSRRGVRRGYTLIWMYRSHRLTRLRLKRPRPSLQPSG